MKVQELLAKPESWTKGALARDRYDREVSVEDPSACRWCLFGAIGKCYVPHGPGREVTSHTVTVQVIVELGQYISNWNDDTLRTHADVLDLCKRLDI